MSDLNLEYYIKMLDDYLDGNLKAHQEEELKTAIQEHPFLQKVVEQHVQARANIRVHAENALRDKFKQKFPAEPEIIKSSSKVYKILALIFLTTALAGITYYFYSSQKVKQNKELQKVENRQFALAEIEDPSYDLFRSNDTENHTEDWNQAVIAFGQNQYLRTKELLSKIENDTAFISKFPGRYYLMNGVAHLKIEQHEEAILFLKKVSNDNPYFDQTQWYLALAKYYKGDIEQAKFDFNIIANDTNHFKNNDAREFLNQVK